LVKFVVIFYEFKNCKSRVLNLRF